MAKEILLNQQEQKVLTKHLLKWLKSNDNDEVLRDILLKTRYEFYFDEGTIRDHIGVPLVDKWNFVHDNCEWNSMEEFHNLLWDFLLQVEDRELRKYLKN